MNLIKKTLTISYIPLLCLTIFLIIHGKYPKRLLEKFNFDLNQEIICHELDSVYTYDDFPYSWKKIKCAAEFAPRDGAGALVFNDSLRLIGGWNPLDKNNFPLICNNEVWSSHNGLNWVRTKDNTFVNKNFNPLLDWEGRHTAGYVLYKNKMWIIGGDANQGKYISDIWNSSDGKNWNLINSEPPWSPRVLHHTFVFNGRIFVIGGQTLPQFASSEEKFFNDIWSSDDGIHWKKESDSSNFSPRGMIGGNAVFKGNVWILGGGTYNTPKSPKRNFFNDVWNSKNGIDWNLVVNTSPWEPRQYHDITVWDNKLWIIGGVNKKFKNLNDVWFSENGLNWIELPNTPWKERHASSIFVFKNSLWVVTGNNMENDVWKLEKIKK